MPGKSSEAAKQNKTKAEAKKPEEETGILQ